MRSFLRFARSAVLAAVLAAAVPASPAAAQTTLEDAEFANPLTGEFDSHLQCPDGVPAECWNTAENSQLMVDGSNRTLVAYRASNYISTNRNALVSHVRENGVWGPATVVADTGSRSISKPEIVRLSNGNLLMTSNIGEQTEAPSSAVWDHTSGSWSSLEALPTLSGGNGRSSFHQLAATADGAVLLAYYDGVIDGGSSRDNMGVFYRYTIDNGWGDPQVLTDITGDRLSDSNTRMSVLPDGTVLIAFYTTCSCASLTAAYGLYAAVIHPDGSYDAPFLLTATGGSPSWAPDIGFTERPDGFAAVAFVDPSYKLHSAIFDMVSREWTMTAITPDLTYGNTTPKTLVDRNDNVVVMSRQDTSAVALVSNGRPAGTADWPSEPTVIIEGPALATNEYFRSYPLGGAALFATKATIDNISDGVLLLWGYDSVIGFTDVISVAQHATDPTSNATPESLGLDSNGVPSLTYRYTPSGRDNHVVASNYDEPLVTVLPPWEPEPEPTAEREQRCELTPDIAVSPAEITIAPGGRAQITIALRNLCADRVYSAADLLLSLSDGLRVVGLPDGWLNLGQRAAWQNLVLQAGETRSFVLTVEADAVLPTAPLHITELYTLGRVVTRIDGIFLTPAPVVEALTAVPAAAPAVDSTAAAAPALPVTLPNTAAEHSALPWLLPAALTVLAGAGLLLQRRRSH